MGWSDWDDCDAELAKNIFGVPDRASLSWMIRDWTQAHLGQAAEILSLDISSGAAAGLQLADGGRAFLKAWPAATPRERLAAQVRIQAALAAEGFVAPAVLVDLRPLGPAQAMLMAFDQSGDLADVRAPGVRDLMARGFAQFIDNAMRFIDEPGLPLMDWPLPEPVWTETHSILFDFEATATGAEWIDTAARQARAIMATAQSPFVVGHHDWSAKNLRVGPDAVAVVYDWDSVFRVRETIVLGAAAAHFPVTWDLPVVETPAVSEMAQFITAYAAARGRRFSDQDLAEIAASATYSRAYKARCEHCHDVAREKWRGSSREALDQIGGYTVAMLKGAAP